jgi:hypothetical protein
LPRMITLSKEASSITLDLSVIKQTGSIQPLSISLKMKRPRFPFTDRVWSPGNKAYLPEKGYSVEPTHYIVDNNVRIALYGDSVESKILSTIHGLFGAGFYHKWMFRNFWPLMWRVIAKSGGLPEYKAYTNPEKKTSSISVEKMEPDVLVIGGGLAGLHAAVSAVKAGSSVMLVDDKDRLGGFYRFSPHREKEIDRIVNVIVRDKAIVLKSSKFLGKFFEGYLVTSPGKLYVVRPKSVIYATGGINPIPLYVNNDIPGTVDLGMFEKIVHLLGRDVWRSGKLAFIGCPSNYYFSGNEFLDEPVYICQDSTDRKGIEHGKILEAKVIKAVGGSKVKSILLDDGNKLDVDMIVSALTPFPDINPVLQDTGSPTYLPSKGRFTVKHDGLGKVSEGVLVAGLAAGLFDEECAIKQAEITGLMASRGPESIGEDIYTEFNDSCKNEISDIKNSNGLNYTLEANDIDYWQTKSIQGLQFIDWDIDIVIEDIVKAYEAGYTTMELIKRYTGVGTGAEQGRLTIPATISILSAYKKTSLESLGWFRIRPPHMLPSMKELAGEVN